MNISATKYCAHCGVQIEADSKFCAECGSKLQETSASQGRIPSTVLPRRRSTRALLAVVGLGILALFVVMVQKSTSGYPSDMPPLDKFVVIGSDRLPHCGRVVTVKAYQANGIFDTWAAFYVDKGKYPFLISRKVYIGFTGEANNYWLDLDGDGVIDEQYDSLGAFDAKYHLTTKAEHPIPALGIEREMKDDKGFCNILSRTKSVWQWNLHW